MAARAARAPSGMAVRPGVGAAHVFPTSKDVSTSIGVLAGRLRLTGAFLVAGTFHLAPESAESAAPTGVPMAALLVPAAGGLAMLGGRWWCSATGRGSGRC